MFVQFSVLILSHVPSYNCVDNCCVPPHSYETSQVFYLKGQGGLELHIDDFGREDKILDIDVVFRDSINKSSYKLYIGCGGCMPSDPILSEPEDNIVYQKTVLEPFTQTYYKSALPNYLKKFNTTLLKNCSSKHFTIRIVSKEDFFWGPVIGLGESFTFSEILSFPIYIRRLHGSYWNENGHYWFWFFIISPLIFVLFTPLYFNFSKQKIKDVNVSLVNTCYEFAILGFLSAFFDKFQHLVMSQMKAEFGSEFWIGLILVVIVPEVTGLTLSIIFLVRKSLSFMWSLISGLGLLFVFGAGYFIGPGFLVLASIVKFVEKYFTLPKIYPFRFGLQD